jgi:hypothetical protein
VRKQISLNLRNGVHSHAHHDQQRGTAERRSVAPAALPRERRTGRLHGAAGDHAAELRRAPVVVPLPARRAPRRELYLPPRGRLFGSREAYGLTYAFCQASAARSSPPSPRMWARASRGFAGRCAHWASSVGGRGPVRRPSTRRRSGGWCRVDRGAKHSAWTNSASDVRKVRFRARADLSGETNDANVESPGGISPPGAPRTVHDPLESHGSRCSAVAMT